MATQKPAAEEAGGHFVSKRYRPSEADLAYIRAHSQKERGDQKRKAQAAGVRQRHLNTAADRARDLAQRRQDRETFERAIMQARGFMPAPLEGTLTVATARERERREWHTFEYNYLRSNPRTQKTREQNASAFQQYHAWEAARPTYLNVAALNTARAVRGGRLINWVRCDEIRWDTAYPQPFPGYDVWDFGDLTLAIRVDEVCYLAGDDALDGIHYRASGVRYWLRAHDLLHQDVPAHTVTGSRTVAWPLPSPLVHVTGLSTAPLSSVLRHVMQAWIDGERVFPLPWLATQPAA